MSGFIRTLARIKGTNLNLGGLGQIMVVSFDLGLDDKLRSLILI